MKLIYPFLAAFLIALRAVAATLVWDAVPDSDLAGYRIYYSNVKIPQKVFWVKTKKHSIDIKKLHLKPGETYQIYIVSVNKENVESDISDLIFYTAPARVDKSR